MPRVSPLQNNFGSGEFSPLLAARTDSERYASALATCKDYVPFSQGVLSRRPGTYYVAPAKENDQYCRLVPFEFSVTQAYVIELGDTSGTGYARFYRNGGAVLNTALNITGITQANPAVVTSNAHGYSNGQHVEIVGVVGMEEVNGRRFIVAGVTANTFQLTYIQGGNVNSTGFGAYSSAGTVASVYEIAMPYAKEDLPALKWTQSADILYLAHPDFVPRKLSRTADTSWTLSTIDFSDGPYLNADESGFTLTPSAATGAAVTITASGSVFASTDVGRLIRIKEGSVWGYVKIVGYTSATVVTADVVNTLTNTAAKSTWRFGVWSATTGYPSCVTFHEDRLFFAGPTSYPQRLDGSQSGDYENFAPSATDGVVSDSSAVGFTLNSNDVNNVRWMVSDEKGLLVGTVAGEWVVRAASISEAISPTNLSASATTRYGSADTQPVVAGKAAIFVQRSGRKLREINYFYDVEGFRSQDLTLLSEHITLPAVTEIAYTKEPQPIIWGVRSDGVLLGCTYEREFESLKAGWHRHEIGGVSDAAGTHSIVESIAVIPSSDSSRQELWLSVKRYVGGVVYRHIEYMTEFFDDSMDPRDAIFVDAALTYDEPIAISGITKANPGVVTTSTSHGLTTGDDVRLSEIMGMTELNDETCTITVLTGTTFSLGVNTTSYTTYISGGEVREEVSTVGGLWHLEGQEVDILADGAVLPSATVTNGEVALSTPSTVVQVGLGYESDAKMMRLEAGAADGTSLGKTRRIQRVAFMLHRSLGLKYGTNFSNLTSLVFRTASDVLGRAVPLYSGIVSQAIDASYDYENQICWRQDQPLPSTILAVMPQMVTQDRT